MAGYRIVPGGVSRGRTALKRPSTQALVLEGRRGASKSSFRRGTVPSDVRKAQIAFVAKAVTVRDQEIKQLDRKRRLTRVTATSAVLGGTATALGGLAQIPKVKARPRLQHLGRVAAGVGVAAGGLGTYGALRGAKVTATDLDIQRKKLGVAKAMPDPSAMATPAGLLKTKTYRASGIRTTTTGKLVRTKANVG